MPAAESPIAIAIHGGAGNIVEANLTPQPTRPSLSPKIEGRL